MLDGIGPGGLTPLRLCLASSTLAACLSRLLKFRMNALTPHCHRPHQEPSCLLCCLLCRATFPVTGTCCLQVPAFSATSPAPIFDPSYSYTQTFACNSTLVGKAVAVQLEGETEILSLAEISVSGVAL